MVRKRRYHPLISRTVQKLKWKLKAHPVIDQHQSSQNNRRNACDSNGRRRNFRTAGDGEDSTGELGSNGKVFGKQQLLSGRQAALSMQFVRPMQSTVGMNLRPMHGRDDKSNNRWIHSGISLAQFACWIFMRDLEKACSGVSIT